MIMHVRPAHISDIPRIVVLGRYLLELHTQFDEEYYTLEQDFDTLFGDWAKQLINHDNEFILVACENEKVCGFISGFIKSLYPWFRTKKVGHITYLVIDTPYQKKGIGKLLEKEASRWFKEKDIHYMEVYTDESNHLGKHAWQRYGYGYFKKFLRKKI